MTKDQVRTLIHKHSSRDIITGKEFLHSSDLEKLLKELEEIEE